MKIPALIAAALLTLLIGTSATVVAQDKYSITAEYDRFQDVTTFGFQPMKTTDPALFFFAMFQCPGRNACKPDAIVFTFALITLQDEPYQGQGIARAIRDGVRQEPYPLKYIGIKRISILPAHVFMAKLRVEGLIKIANSKTVEYQIDTTEFALTPDNLAALRDLASRISP